MATWTDLNKLLITTDAEFRAWGSLVSSRLAAAGWVKTADTGQIDWATVTRPTASGQKKGYEVWRPNDVLQATAPFFLKVEYGASPGVSLAAGMYFTLGTQTNGAGALFGQVSATLSCGISAGAAGGSPDVNGNYRFLFSGDPSRFTMALQQNGDNAHSVLFTVERSKSVTGADTAAGMWMMIGSNQGSATASAFCPTSGAVPGEERVLAMHPQAGTGLNGMDVNLYPIYPMSLVMQNPARSVVAYHNSDVAANTVEPGALYGVSQTWYFLGSGMRNVSPFSSSSWVPAIRWE